MCRRRRHRRPCRVSGPVVDTPWSAEMASLRPARRRVCSTSWSDDELAMRAVRVAAGGPVGSPHGELVRRHQHAASVAALGDAARPRSAGSWSQDALSTGTGHSNGAEETRRCGRGGSRIVANDATDAVRTTVRRSVGSDRDEPPGSSTGRDGRPAPVRPRRRRLGEVPTRSPRGRSPVARRASSRETRRRLDGCSQEPTRRTLDGTSMPGPPSGRPRT